MKFIDIDSLNNRKENIREDWMNKKPFRYVVIDDFFKSNEAEKILNEYPDIDKSAWENTTYINQKNKFVKTKFDDLPVIGEVFDELRSPEVLKLLQEITSIDNLLADDELFGAGLHQSITGAFLDVHVDFNIHPKTKFHRRMNLLVYMNKDWKKDYNGYLELWDMDKKKLLEEVEPKLNRCVIFETNEISFHGHPKPLNTPKGLSRKSISVYYYTKERPENEIVNDHNTIYVNTEGSKGLIKNFIAGIKALKERIVK